MTISNLTKKMHHSFYGINHDYILSSVGVARTGVEISIVSQDGEEVPLIVLAKSLQDHRALCRVI